VLQIMVWYCIVLMFVVVVMHTGCSGTDESWNMNFLDVQDLYCYILLLGK